MSSEDCWCRHLERWHQAGVCSKCLQNEQKFRKGSSKPPAPSQHEFGNELPDEQRTEWQKRYEEAFGGQYVYLMTDL